MLVGAATLVPHFQVGWATTRVTIFKKCDGKDMQTPVLNVLAYAHLTKSEGALGPDIGCTTLGQGRVNV